MDRRTTASDAYQSRSYQCLMRSRWLGGVWSSLRPIYIKIRHARYLYLIATLSTMWGYPAYTQVLSTFDCHVLFIFLHSYANSLRAGVKSSLMKMSLI